VVDESAAGTRLKKSLTIVKQYVLLGT